MKRGFVHVLAVGLVLLIGVGVASPLSALEAEPTTDSHWLKPSPLMISAYQRTSGVMPGDDIGLLEVYNDGSQPLDIAQWEIRGSFKKSSTATIEFVSMRIMPRHSGLLAPGSHAVIDAGVGVTNASYDMTSWSGQKPVGTLVSLTVIPPAEGTATNDYTLKQTGTNYTELWRRMPLSSPGYTTTLSSFSTGSTGLFDDGLYLVPSIPPLRIVEIYPYASDCTPFDDSVLCGDYMKLYNPTDQTITLDDYVVRTDSSSLNRTSSNTIHLSGEIAPRDYRVVARTDDDTRLSLTNDGGYVWLEDTWGLARYDDTLASYPSAGTTKRGYSWAQKPDATWDWTSRPSPLSDNVFPTVLADVAPTVDDCPVGKYRNPETNRCRTIEEAVNSLAACPEGQYRNPETNRCRSIAVATGASLTPCGEGQERNPATNRCRSIASAVAELLPCDEGFERNPATNRCRKITSIAAVPPSLTGTSTPENATAPSLLSNPYSLVAVALLGGIGYAVYEWRSEIRDGYKKLAAAIDKK